jgi:hypothetical protein
VIMNDADLSQPTASLVRAYESTRVVLPTVPDASAIQTRLAPALLAIQPEGTPLHLALPRQLPVLREPFVQHLIEEVSRTNAVYTASTGLVELVPGLGLPLTGADIIILSKNQLIMAYRIALVSGKEGSPRVLMGEIVGVVGGGLLFRQVARELVGLIPVIGIAPRVVVSYAGTRLVGQVVRAWALEGRLVDRNELQAMYAAALQGGRAVAVTLKAQTERVRRPRRRLLLPPHRGDDGRP